MLLSWRMHSTWLWLIKIMILLCLNFCLFSGIIGWNRLTVIGSNTVGITGISKTALTLRKYNPISSLQSLVALLLNSETIVRNLCIITLLEQKLIALSCNLLKRIVVFVHLILVSYARLVSFYVPDSFWKTYLLFFFCLLFSLLSLLRLHCFVINCPFQRWENSIVLVAVHGKSR